MNRKIVAIIAVALVTIIGASSFLAGMWASDSVILIAGAASVTSIRIFNECSALTDFTTFTFPAGVTSGQTYTVPMYVKNNGTVALYLTYSPKEVILDSQQTIFNITATVAEQGLPCQLSDIPDVPMLVKDPTNCVRGFLLGSGQVAKVYANIFVNSTYGNGPWTINFLLEGCSP